MCNRSDTCLISSSLKGGYFRMRFCSQLRGSLVSVRELWKIVSLRFSSDRVPSRHPSSTLESYMVAERVAETCRCQRVLGVAVRAATCQLRASLERRHFDLPRLRYGSAVVQSWLETWRTGPCCCSSVCKLAGTCERRGSDVQTSRL